MDSFRKFFGDVRAMLATGVVIALTSEIYVHLFINNFRVSPAVILFPVFLVTVARGADVVSTGLVTSVLVMVLRQAIGQASGADAAETFIANVPGGIFYFVYSILFVLLIRDREEKNIRKIGTAAFVCDLLSNIIEVWVREALSGIGGVSLEVIARLAAIALIRAVFAMIALCVAGWYHTLVIRQEHEERYRRLFMLTTGLKSEIYLMHSNSEQIEKVMGNAYHLYEELQKYDLPGSVGETALEIAREVHEIKKDYLRIIQGIEEEIGKDTEGNEMRLSDIFEILLETARTAVREKKLDITVRVDAADDFAVKEHYSLMSILNNLVNNAIEAIENDKKSGHILVTERTEGNQVVIRVRDDGPGIPEKHRESIFRMGYSTKFDRKTGNIYRGVGLCGVKHLVEDLFHGTIEVDSRTGEYTLFTVSLPAAAFEREGESGAG